MSQYLRASRVCTGIRSLQPGGVGLQITRTTLHKRFQLSLREFFEEYSAISLPVIMLLQFFFAKFEPVRLSLWSSLPVLAIERSDQKEFLYRSIPFNSNDVVPSCFLQVARIIFLGTFLADFSASVAKLTEQRHGTRRACWRISVEGAQGCLSILSRLSHLTSHTVLQYHLKLWKHHNCHELIKEVKD